MRELRRTLVAGGDGSVGVAVLPDWQKTRPPPPTPTPLGAAGGWPAPLASRRLPNCCQANQSINSQSKSKSLSELVIKQGNSVETSR